MRVSQGTLEYPGTEVRLEVPEWDTRGTGRRDPGLEDKILELTD